MPKNTALQDSDAINEAKNRLLRSLETEAVTELKFTGVEEHEEDIVDARPGRANIQYHPDFLESMRKNLGKNKDEVLEYGGKKLRTHTNDPLLPTDAAARKSLPIFTGVVQYFPLALAEVARVSKLGNDQHNPGQPLHWARGKSMDQMDTAQRHMLDWITHKKDTDGAYHLAKAAWRILAQLQLDLEAERNAYQEVDEAGT
jgi:hypothetical protein